MKYKIEIKIRKLLLYIGSSILLISCSEKAANKYTNELVHETSPYLLQHAYNPVNWKAWNEKSLATAKSEKKLILISIGYASCHWCHVMERESFQDSLVAQTMNANFINIKVDREERPDVDQVYMNAVQLMTGNGGWPLNVIALPDGRPVWGGTYFSKEQWKSALDQISKVYIETPDKLYEFAAKLEQGVKELEVISINNNEAVFDEGFIDETVQVWSKEFDNTYGGINAEPKFMMPNKYQFLLRYGYQNNHTELQDFVNLSLTKMAYGGIYDQLGGGFSRYSIDKKWHVPHFEKMLYDNAQLVSLYADAYLITKNKLYKDVVTETLTYVKENMTAVNDAFYSSLDAESKTSNGESVEGAFYTWTKENLKNLLQEDFELFSAYYNVNEYGFWENNEYILLRKLDDKTFIENENLTDKSLQEKKKSWKAKLLKARIERLKPKTDDKTLTSWNAMMLKGYLDAYRVFGEMSYLKTAERNANFIINHQLRKDGGLNHNFKDNKSTINGYLEDYATVIESFILLYETTLDEKWLTNAQNLVNYTFEHFYDEKSKMFFFTSSQDEVLFSRTIEYRDGVIPASNSIMAKNLFKLSHFFDNEYYKKTATTMLNNVKPEMQKYPSEYANWFDFMLNYTHPYYEVAIVGEEVKQKINELNKTYLPNKLIIGSVGENKLPLLENRYSPGETLIYVCTNKVCKLPSESVTEAIELIREGF